MHTKTHIVGFIRQHARHSLQAQKAAMAERGITKVYTDLDLMIRQRRHGAGDVVAVRSLLLLADPTAKRQAGGMRQSLYKTIDAIEAAGAAILELETGRSTADARQRDLMIRDAVDSLARTRAGTRRPGRPRTTWTEQEVAIMREHWFSRRHETNEAAVAVIVEAGVRRATVSKAGKLLGPSGRQAGGKR